MSQYRVGKYGIYEGEWWFSCTTKNCKGFLVDYSLNEYANYAEHFLYSTPIHTNASCQLCDGALEWGGYSGGLPISNSLGSLLLTKHYMASTVILSAIIEKSLQNLLWAPLVNGIEQGRANSDMVYWLTTQYLAAQHPNREHSVPFFAGDGGGGH
ncbi:MAG: hypothetical protein ACRERU_16915 [Methylococcales bacterium]